MEDVKVKYENSLKRRKKKITIIAIVLIVLASVIVIGYYQLIRVIWFIGNVVPTIHLVSPTHNSTLSTAYVNFTWESSDADGDTLYHYFMIDVLSTMNSPLLEGHHTGQRTYYNYTNISDGIWWWKVEVSDTEDYSVSETWKVIVKKNMSNNFPQLLYPNIFPHEGTPQTTFTYYVTYLDVDNDSPTYIKVCIDGVNYDMVKAENSNNYSRGVKYQFSTSGLSIGNHTFVFYASDGQAVVSTDLYHYPTVYSEGSALLNHLPRTTLIYPSNNAVLTSKRVTFRWQTVDIDGNLVREELYLCKESLSSPYQVYGISSGESLELTRGTYFWKVIAYDTYTSNQSEVWSFFVDVPGKQNKITIQPDSTKQYRGGKFTGTLIITNEGGYESYEVYWYMYLKKDGVVYGRDSGALALSTTSEVCFRLDVPNTSPYGNYTIEAFTYDKPLIYEDAQIIGHDSIEVEVIASQYFQVPSEWVIPLSVILILLGVVLIGIGIKFQVVQLCIVGVAVMMVVPLVYNLILPTTVSIVGWLLVSGSLFLFFTNIPYFEQPTVKTVAFILAMIGLVLYMSGVIT